MPETTRVGKAGNPFEVGIVMAGAISAGAYTAGAFDFLIQALDEWHKSKDGQEPDCPPHQVRLKVLSGASAGGLTGWPCLSVLTKARRSIGGTVPCPPLGPAIRH